MRSLVCKVHCSMSLLLLIHWYRVVGLKSSPQKQSLIKEQSYYDTSLRRTLPPELALDADWSADGSSVAEVSSATEDSIVTETRKRLSYLTRETENLQSAFQSLTRRSPPKHGSWWVECWSIRCVRVVQVMIELCFSRMSADCNLSDENVAGIGTVDVCNESSFYRCCDRASFWKRIPTLGR